MEDPRLFLSELPLSFFLQPLPLLSLCQGPSAFQALPPLMRGLELPAPFIPDVNNLSFPLISAV